MSNLIARLPARCALLLALGLLAQIFRISGTTCRWCAYSGHIALFRTVLFGQQSWAYQRICDRLSKAHHVHCTCNQHEKPT